LAADQERFFCQSADKGPYFGARAAIEGASAARSDNGFYPKLVSCSVERGFLPKARILLKRQQLWRAYAGFASQGARSIVRALALWVLYSL